MSEPMSVSVSGPVSAMPLPNDAGVGIGVGFNTGVDIGAGVGLSAGVRLVGNVVSAGVGVGINAGVRDAGTSDAGVVVNAGVSASAPASSTSAMLSTPASVSTLAPVSAMPTQSSTPGSVLVSASAPVLASASVHIPCRSVHPLTQADILNATALLIAGSSTAHLMVRRGARAIGPRTSVRDASAAADAGVSGVGSTPVPAMQALVGP